MPSREESLTLRDIVRIIGRLPVAERTRTFAQIMADQRETSLDGLLLREVLTPTDREVTVRERDGSARAMLMFGANDYLGLGNHPYVRERMADVLRSQGAGLSGPPLLNGYNALARSLEERLAAYEGKDDALLFSSGYTANVGLMSGLPGRRDTVVYDAHSHASFHDGVRMAGNPTRSFAHNDPAALGAALSEHRGEGKDDALLFSSGYTANVGLMSGLPGRRDTVVYDAHSHASFHDGVRMAGNPTRSFAHNDPAALGAALSEHRGVGKDVFVCVEGVYSMSGDLAPLDQIATQCRRHDALLLVDDAHGTGVAGPLGRGTATRFGVEDSVTAVMGTFSKSFAVTGGFIAADAAVVEYLRFFSRPYMFSSSLPPATLAAVHAGLDILEREPERHDHLMALCRYTADGLRALGHPADERTPIFPIPVPLGMDIRASVHDFHRQGIFLNHIEFPAVATAEQRFRVSLSAAHTFADIDRLMEAVEAVWHRHGPQGDSIPAEPLAF